MKNQKQSCVALGQRSFPLPAHLKPENTSSALWLEWFIPCSHSNPTEYQAKMHHTTRVRVTQPHAGQEWHTSCKQSRQKASSQDV